MKWKGTASCMWELEEKVPAMVCGFEKNIEDLRVTFVRGEGTSTRDQDESFRPKPSGRAFGMLARRTCPVSGAADNWASFAHSGALLVSDFMRRPSILVLVLLAAFDAPETPRNPMDPLTWTIGPIINGRNYSHSMSFSPTANPGGGWYFDFPQADGVTMSLALLQK
jgi:hypothetical protein